MRESGARPKDLLTPLPAQPQEPSATWILLYCLKYSQYFWDFPSLGVHWAFGIFLIWALTLNGGETKEGRKLPFLLPLKLAGLVTLSRPSEFVLFRGLKDSCQQMKEWAKTQIYPNSLSLFLKDVIGARISLWRKICLLHWKQFIRKVNM